MKLHELLENFEKELTLGSLDVPVTSLHLNSKEVTEGGAFFAVAGTATDGHNYIEEAIKNGAKIIIHENEIDDFEDEVTYVRISGLGGKVGPIAAEWYYKPSEQMKVVGITGTNGKTTVATLLYQLFELLEYKAGLLSTVQTYIHEESIPTERTTADPITVQRLMYEMVEVGCTHCFMEVSSHATDQGRVNGVHFTGGIFTNISHEHIDYHNTFEAYLRAKQTFFDTLHPHAWALANYDDTNGEFMLQNTRATPHFYGLTTEDDEYSDRVDFKGEIEALSFTGIEMDINDQHVTSKLTGRFNAYNLLSVFGAARLLDEDAGQIAEQFQYLDPADGRFERVMGNGKIGIVDYAHSPDALQNVLESIYTLKQESQKVITVIGCGGDRDKEKRPLMARIAERYSDYVVLTADNPRSEPVVSIIDDMKRGLQRPDHDMVMAVENREEAIETAADLAEKGDIVLVAGKGHETYQEIDGVRYDFDDREVLRTKLDE